ncbi:MAG: hypothetical protein JRF38_19235, partial [Deltaproteobacteria bacterium]|nr:hypothetical protein [Deltaproteobacteria bacterium]
PAPLAIPTQAPAILWKDAQLTVIRGKGTIAEGWTLSAHHWLSPSDTSILFKGDGTATRNNVAVIDTYAGDGSASKYFGGMGGPAVEAQIPTPSALAMDDGGNLFIISSHLPGWQNWRSYILKVDPAGIVTKFADAYGMSYYDGFLAIDSDNNLYHSSHVVYGGGGGNGGCIQKVTPDGTRATIIGTCGSGDDYFAGVHADNQGNIFAARQSHQTVLKRDPAGIVTVVAGNGSRGHQGDGGPATEARLYDPEAVLVDDDGNLYIAGYERVRKVDPSGTITTVAGGGAPGNKGDGGPATEAYLQRINALAKDPDGNLYLADEYHHSIRRVDKKGIISTVAGSDYTVTSSYGDYAGDGGAATAARLSVPTDVILDPEGSFYIADIYNHRVRKVSPPSAALKKAMASTDIAFAEKNGVGHIMSTAGLHLRTIDLDTGATLLEFDYDQNSRLVSIFDQFGNQTQIERDPNGVPTAIVSPDQLRTALLIDADNHLRQITYPGSRHYEFEYTPNGLLTLKTEPGQNRFLHTYDEDGRLTDSEDEEGGHWYFSRTAHENGQIQYDILTREGNTTSHLDATDSTGAFESLTTAPDGSQSQYTESADGLKAESFLPCGMYNESIFDLDSEYKFKYLEKLTETTPGGLQRVWRKTRIYTDENADRIPDIITEEIAVNGRTSSMVENLLTSQTTAVSPEGRSVTISYDPDTLRVHKVAIPGLYDTGYTYDARGRLTSVKRNLRETRYAYDPNGFVASVTDPESKTTFYDYDEIGRVTSINRADGGMVALDYDANGNLVVLTIQEAVDHGFGFNRVNLKNAYQTPLSGSYEFKYDRDRQPTEVIYPSKRKIVNTYVNARLDQIQTPEGTIDFTYVGIS